MDIVINPSRPAADTLAFAIAKGAAITLPIAASATMAAGAQAARFTGVGRQAVWGKCEIRIRRG